MLLFSANQVLDQNIRVIITGMCTLFPDTSHSTQFNCGFLIFVKFIFSHVERHSNDPKLKTLRK